jgi:hypothetical protein
MLSGVDRHRPYRPSSRPGKWNCPVQPLLFPNPCNRQSHQTHPRVGLMWIARAAIDTEGSGYFLVPALNTARDGAYHVTRAVLST